MRKPEPGSLAAYISEHRRKLLMTQEEAAEAAGISRTQWVRLEHGEGGTKPETLESVAGALSFEKGTVPYNHLFQIAGMYPPGVPPEQFIRFQQQAIANAWDVEIRDDLTDEYDAFDLSDDPVIQALATGLDSDAIEAARSAMLENGRMTLAEFVKKRRAEGVVGARAQDE